MPSVSDLYSLKQYLAVGRVDAGDEYTIVCSLTFYFPFVEMFLPRCITQFITRINCGKSNNKYRLRHPHIGNITLFQSILKAFPIQGNLSWETTGMGDHLSWQTTHFWKEIYFNITESVTRDHLSWQTPFCGQWGGLSRQVLLYSEE